MVSLDLRPFIMRAFLGFSCTLGALFSMILRPRWVCAVFLTPNLLAKMPSCDADYTLTPPLRGPAAELDLRLPFLLGAFLTIFYDIIYIYN